MNLRGAINMDMLVVLILFGVFFLLLGMGVPIAISIAVASVLAICAVLPVDVASMVVAQKLATGLDSFSLLAIPFFIVAGSIMNHGGIALRLVEFAKLIGGFLPGALAHVNILSNMLFGSISGSAVASAAAVGGTMAPIQKSQGYPPEYSAAANIASCPSGLMIPPSNALIVYALISGGTSLSALFVAGYVPGFLMGLSAMLVAGLMAKKHNYPLVHWPGLKPAVQTTLSALPALGLVIVVMGGIISGHFTATEASAFAVVYALILALVVYRQITVKDLPQIIMKALVTSAMVLFLVGASMSMSWAMAIAQVPQMISSAMLEISSNPIVILLLINLVLLVVGIFMDLTPALLIFTPIFLPVAIELGMDPVHFGIMMTLNLCIGICTPPVGSALFVGCAVAKVNIAQVIKPLMPFYAALIALLMLVTYVPEVSLFLPKLLVGY